MIATGLESAQSALAWPPCPYRVRGASPDELSAPLPPSVLGAVAYGEPPCSPSDPRRVHVPLPLLHGRRGGEIWESLLPVVHGREGIVGYAENGTVMLLSLSLPEADLGNTEGAAERLYRELLRFTATKGYPHLLRVWNFLGQINQGHGDDERYRRFCVGRHRALSAASNFERRLSAATAIGTAGGGLSVMVLAGRRPGRQIENPRQLSAYRYPRTYGERSPSFARATYVPWADGSQLLVSGTASIVGHATAHAGDAQAQLRQTAANLQALLAQPSLARRGFLPEQYTLYLRHEEDLITLLPLLDRMFGNAPLLVLKGDICRRELMLEVEAIYRLPAIRRP